MSGKLLCASIVLAAGTVATADNITEYDDRTAFETALGSFTFEDFTDTFHFPITTGILNSETNLPDIGIFPGTMQEGVTYSTPIGEGNFFNIDAGGGYDGGFLDGFNPSDRVVTIVFEDAATGDEQPVTGFGFDTSGLCAGTFDVTIVFTDGSQQTFTNSHMGGFAFFGFVSDEQDIAGAIVGNNDCFFGFDFDNFTFGGEGGAPTGGRLYFSEDGNFDGLYAIDTNTGAATNLGESGVKSSSVGLAPSPFSGELYGSTWTELARINQDGSGHTIVATSNAEGMAYDADNDILYGAINGAFFMIDQSTGEQTDLPGPGEDVEGLAYGNGGVYGLADGSGNLYFFDTSGGGWSLIGSTNVTGQGSALAYDPGNNVLYTKSAASTLVYSVDPATAAATAIGDTGIVNGGGLAFVPGADECVVMEFDAFEIDNDLVNAIGEVIGEDGYTLTKGDDRPFEFSVFGQQEARYPGSAAIFNNTVDGLIRLEKDDGGAFDMLSIDISNLNNNGPVTVNFTGFLSGGGTVNDSYTTSGADNLLETFAPDGFTDVVAVEWTQEAPFHQFDDITLCTTGGIPCFADCDGNGELNILDFVCYQALFQSGDLAADCNGDGVLNILDFVCFQAEFQAGCD